MMTLRSLRGLGLVLTLAGAAAAQTVTLTDVSPNPATPQDNVFIIAQVTPPAQVGPSGGPIPWPVSFFENGNLLGTVDAETFGGFAQISHGGFSVGTHVITATIPSSPAPIASLPVNLVVRPNLVVSPTPSTYCQPVTLTGAPPIFFEASSIIFVDTFATNLTTLGTVVLDSSGAASFTTSSPLPAGTHTLGAAVFSPFSTFATLTHIVNKLTPGVTLLTAPNPSALGQSVVMTATIGSCNATGTVTFLDGGVALGTVPVASGMAVFSTSALALGTHPITARYDGDSNNNVSVSNTVNQIVTSTPSMVFTAEPNPSAACQNVILTATLTPPDIPTPPASFTRRIAGPPVTGTVTFADGNTPLGTVPINLGVATLQTTLLAGNHRLTAVYNPDAGYSPTSAFVNQVVNPAVPTVTLTSTPNPSVLNQAVTMTAMVVGCRTVTGSINFLDGTGSLATVALSGGQASFTTSTLTVGTHPLSARYGGDTNNTAATSNTVNQVVGKNATTTTVTAAPNPSIFGQAVLLTATVRIALSSQIATGTVTFLDGSTALGSATLNASGIATLTVSTLAVGSHTITATYGGSETLGGSSGTVDVVVNKASTTTTISLSTTSAIQGSAVTVTATVVPASASGQVTFFDNGTSVGTATLSNGTASISIRPGFGAHAVTASYGGDNSFLGSTSTAASLRVLNPVTIEFTAVPNPAGFGQVVTLTARLSPASVTGVVTFKEGSTTLGVAGLANGVATATVSTLAVGNHTLTANYAGDSATSPGSATLTLTVGKATTTLSLSANPNSLEPGGSTTLTARVTPAGATGTVTFSEGDQTLGSAQLSNGTASIQATFATAVTHMVTASYGGDTNFNGSVSSPVAIAVGLPPTTTTLTATPSNPGFGQAVALAATVSPAGATGSVTFSDGATTLGTATLSGGSASITVSSLLLGPHALTATYSGDATHGGSSGNATVTVVRAPTTTSVAASPSPATAGQAVTIVATIAPAAATGTVTFTDGGTMLGTATLTNGSASLTTNALAEGAHTLGVTYGGDGNFLGSSGSAALTVNPPPGASLAISGPASIPDGTVGRPYPSQTLTATGGTLPYTWTLAGSSTTTDLSVANSGNNGVLSGTPTTAGDFTVTVQVRDSATPPVTVSKTYNVTFAFEALPTINVSSSQISLGQGYPIALRGTLTLTFTPNAANLPANFVNRQLLFQNGTNTVQVDIPANSTAPVGIPAFQQGSIAGTITVTLTGVVNAQTGQAVTPFPSPAPVATVTVARGAPVIEVNSVKISNVSGTGFQVIFNGSSNTRDLTRADLTFTAANGTQLTGSQTFQVDLSAAGNGWFGSSDGQNGGGTFSVTVPFTFSGDAQAIPASVSVTVTNSAGTSAAVSGGR